MNDPRVRYLIRVLVVGAVAAASSLQAGGDWLDAVLAGIVALGAYAGIGAATPLEPSVGRYAAKKG